MSTLTSHKRSVTMLSINLKKNANDTLYFLIVKQTDYSQACYIWGSLQTITS